ncbi:MAG: glucose-6-phosphate dehydrogenase assembly protein OpcA [Undibacterium sp.]|nr:glucose-6-phosphate dehydrogenase assembly protein OpcA [Opitutaceae bacterium]
MPAIFNSLPGIEVPVGSISKSLSKMWADTAASGGPAPASDDTKATQVNFVLHLGLNTTSEDAVAQFQTAVRFSHRYPSRVVVLCPLRDDTGVTDIRAKVYGECFLGKSKGDTRCCEFVILSYPLSAREFLESQVSICLSTDLPLYYWAHRFTESVKLADYRYLLTRARRVLLDSAIAPADALTFAWPRPEAVRDLVYARLLPVRQSLGQFLSRYPMPALSGGLKTVSLAHGGALTAEARVLLSWLQDRIGQCGENRAEFKLNAPPDSAPTALSLAFTYADSKSFSWNGDVSTGAAVFFADFGTGRTELHAAVSLLPPENALSEAMFF